MSADVLPGPWTPASWTRHRNEAIYLKQLRNIVALGVMTPPERTAEIISLSGVRSYRGMLGHSAHNRS